MLLKIENHVSFQSWVGPGRSLLMGAVQTLTLQFRALKRASNHPYAISSCWVLREAQRKYSAEQCQWKNIGIVCFIMDASPCRFPLCLHCPVYIFNFFINQSHSELDEIEKCSLLCLCKRCYVDYQKEWLYSALKIK